jgi:hypothetical protein
MRECTVAQKTYNKSWIDLPIEEAWFHQFITETDTDGVTCAMAIVEWKNGKVDTVPLQWITLKPYIVPEMVCLESTPLIDPIYLEEALVAFQTMCRDIPNQLRR